jgi:putative endonuclease
LKSIDGEHYYTGLTNNVDRRLTEHNSGQVKPTKAHKPFRVVHVESFQERRDARAREKFFKTGIGRESRNRILNN